MGDRINILMTGSGSPGGPGISKAIKTDNRVQLYTADANPHASGRFFADGFEQIPMAEEMEFVPNLIEICSRLKINVLFPLVTKELPKLSQNKRKFKDIGTEVIVSNFESLSITNNKCRLYSHLKKNNIPVPKFKMIQSFEDFNQAVSSLGYPEFPVVMKPCVGNGSRGIRIMDTKQDRFDMLFKHKPDSLFTTLEEVSRMIFQRQMPCVLLSEYLPGDEVTIDTIIENGTVQDLLIRTRETTNNGISTSGRFIESKDISDYVNTIVNSLPGLFGPVGFQLKKNVDGDYRILESNPRIQGTSIAAMGLGVNLPLKAVYAGVGERYPVSSRRSGIGFVRYYKEIFYEC